MNINFLNQTLHMSFKYIVWKLNTRFPQCPCFILLNSIKLHCLTVFPSQLSVPSAHLYIWVSLYHVPGAGRTYTAPHQSLCFWSALSQPL